MSSFLSPSSLLVLKFWDAENFGHLVGRKLFTFSPFHVCLYLEIHFPVHDF